MDHEDRPQCCGVQNVHLFHLFVAESDLVEVPLMLVDNGHQCGKRIGCLRDTPLNAGTRQLGRWPLVDNSMIEQIRVVL